MRQVRAIRLAEPSIITTSTDAREWKDRSSKRQIDMSSIRHDGRVLSTRKRYARTYIRTRTHVHSRRSHTHVRPRQFCSVRKRHPRSFALCAGVVAVCVSACVCARTVGGIHHCATNFRDKYFTDGHYAGTRVFARYKLWMIAATAVQRWQGGQIVSTKGRSTRGDAIGRKGKSLMPVKFARPP